MNDECSVIHRNMFQYSLSLKTEWWRQIWWGMVSVSRRQTAIQVIFIYVVWITLYEVCCISRPTNRVRKLLCNLRTLKPRRVNIAVLPRIHTFTTFPIVTNMNQILLEHWSQWKKTSEMFDATRKHLLLQCRKLLNTSNFSCLPHPAPPFYCPLILKNHHPPCHYHLWALP